MSKIALTLPDDSVLEVDAGSTGASVALGISRGLAKKAVAYRLDGKTYDLSLPFPGPGKLQILTFDDTEGRDICRHSAAHVMAQAVLELFPGSQATIGPVVDDRFYYDFHTAEPFSPEDLEKIELRMAEIIKEDRSFVREEYPRNEALAKLGEFRNKFKEEVLAEIAEGETVSLYRQGSFVDLCRGPHVPSTGKIGAVKLLSIAGAYWRGDQKNEQLQRIYGTCFPDKKVLKEYLDRLEEAKRRDHRKLGKELDLFLIHQWCPGAVFWLPKGQIIYDALRKASSDYHRREGYQEVFTPLLFKKDLFETSGHWQHYKDDMFIFEEDNTEYALKPMNCPSHILIYGSRLRSYRELPYRLFDQGVLHRNEAAGALGGLTRVRQFCQDDAHIILTKEMIGEEITRIIRMVKRIYEVFEMPTKVFLSTRPEKAMGEKALWDHAEQELREAIRANDLEFQVNEGDGAFYGPKIDFRVKDSLAREHQTATIQLDFQMPMRFGVKYVDQDGTEKTPVMIHRAIFGSFERFMGVLIEHYGGSFPAWLAPVQCCVMTISDKSSAYAKQVADELSAAGIRCELDVSDEKINAKVRLAETMKIPYMAVVGEKEAENKTVSVRAHGRKDLGVMPLGQFEEHLKAEIDAGGF